MAVLNLRTSRAKHSFPQIVSYCRRVLQRAISRAPAVILWKNIDFTTVPGVCFANSPRRRNQNRPPKHVLEPPGTSWSNATSKIFTALWRELSFDPQILKNQFFHCFFKGEKINPPNLQPKSGQPPTLLGDVVKLTFLSKTIVSCTRERRFWYMIFDGSPKGGIKGG